MHQCLFFYNTCSGICRRAQCRFCTAQKCNICCHCGRRMGNASTLCLQTSCFWRVRFFQCFLLAHNLLFCSLRAFFPRLLLPFFSPLFFKFVKQIFKFVKIIIFQNNFSFAFRIERNFCCNTQLLCQTSFYLGNVFRFNFFLFRFFTLFYL